MARHRAHTHLTRESWVSMCLGPSGVAVMKGRLMLVWVRLLISHLAFSAASVNLQPGTESSKRDGRGVNQEALSTYFNCKSNLFWTIQRSRGKRIRYIVS